MKLNMGLCEQETLATEIQQKDRVSWWRLRKGEKLDVVSQRL